MKNYPNAPSGVAVIIPTLNRPAYLLNTIEQIDRQTYSNIDIYVVDASDEKMRLANLPNINRNIITTYSEIKSLTNQKNLALDKIFKKNYLYFSVIDDDMIFDEKYIEIHVNFLNYHSDFIGVSSFVVSKNEERQTPQGLKGGIRRIFLLDSSRSDGILTSGGVNIPIRIEEHSKEVAFVQTNWLYGCSTWRLSKLQNVYYDRSLMGSCIYEDVLYSEIAHEYGKLAVLTSHKIRNLEIPIARNGEFFNFRMWRINRRKSKKYLNSSLLGRLAYIWCDIGYFLEIIYSKLMRNKK